jgi:hypothetical protein
MGEVEREQLLEPWVGEDASCDGFLNATICPFTARFNLGKLWEWLRVAEILAIVNSTLRPNCLLGGKIR